MESKCLARYNDDVWYPATVVDVLEGHQFKVMFEAYENTETVELEDIVPQGTVRKLRLNENSPEIQT